MRVLPKPRLVNLFCCYRKAKRNTQAEKIKGLGLAAQPPPLPLVGIGERTRIPRGRVLQGRGLCAGGRSNRVLPGGGDPGRWKPTLPRSPDARGRELFGGGAPEGQGGQGGGGGCRVKGPQREGAGAAGGTPLPTVGASQGRGPALPRPRGTGRSAGEAKSGFNWETTRGRGLGGNWPPKRAPLWSYPGPLQPALGESLSLPPHPARRPKGTGSQIRRKHTCTNRPNSAAPWRARFPARHRPRLQVGGPRATGRASKWAGLQDAPPARPSAMGWSSRG